MCVCRCYQSYDEERKSTGIRRLSSPIVNPNFEEDFNAALTMTLNPDEVLASLSCVSMALASSADDDNELVVDQGPPVNRDDSLDRDEAIAVNHAQRDEVCYRPDYT